MTKPRRTNKNREQTNAPRTILEAQTRKSKTNIKSTTNRALITRWWRILSDLGWNSSRTKM